MQILARIFHGKIRLPSSKSYNVERCLCTTFEYGTISEPAVLYCMKCFERSTEIAAEDDFKRAAGSCKEHRRHRSQSKQARRRRRQRGRRDEGAVAAAAARPALFRKSSLRRARASRLHLLDWGHKNWCMQPQAAAAAPENQNLLGIVARASETGGHTTRVVRSLSPHAGRGGRGAGRARGGKGATRSTRARGSWG